MANLLFEITIVIAGLAVLLSLYRFFAGPRVVDRVVAFDTMTIISIAFMALFAHHTGRTIFMDTALVYGLLSFLGVIVVARYLERGL
jgi:multicomponent Na+:H+ antiporter subunit F